MIELKDFGNFLESFLELLDLGMGERTLLGILGLEENGQTFLK
jgi:hypothetical protein